MPWLVGHWDDDVTPTVGGTLSDGTGNVLIELAGPADMPTHDLLVKRVIGQWTVTSATTDPAGNFAHARLYTTVGDPSAGTVSAANIDEADEATDENLMWHHTFRMPNSGQNRIGHSTGPSILTQELGSHIDVKVARRLGGIQSLIFHVFSTAVVGAAEFRVHCWLRVLVAYVRSN